MDKISALFAKVAGLQHNFKNIQWSRNNRIGGTIVDHLINQYIKYAKELVVCIPELYSDLPIITIYKPFGSIPPSEKNPISENIYTYEQIEPIIQSINYIIEVRANSRIGEKVEDHERPKRVFLSHGRSSEWYKVQAYIERDMGLQTLELAQEPILGRTVLQKLNEESNRCGYAVIVMTGDDIVGDEIRARENVLHEIGFFQGKLGLQNITLLHEEGVNIPSNIDGLVYISFPKVTVEATFGALARELKAQLI